VVSLRGNNLWQAVRKVVYARATIVGSAAASVGTSTATDSKASVEGDTTRMAKTVATEIEDLMVAQQWIPPMKTSKQSETAQVSQ